jgi:signal transduction histidine kinase
VHESLREIRKVVSTGDDRSFIMRLRPYRSTEDKIEGVVLTFTEITELQSARETIESQTYQEGLAVLGVYALEQDDLETIMHRAVQQSCLILQAQGAVMATYNPKEDTFNVEVEEGCNFGEAEMPNDEKWDLGYALQSEKPVVVADYDKESRFAVSPVLEECNFASSVHIAVRGAEDTFGVLGFYSTEKKDFSEYDLNFIQSVANILGNTIAQQRTKEDLAESNAQLQKAVKQSKQYQKEILNNSLVQRWDMGGYLHDNLGQLLASAKIILADLENKVAGMDGGAENVAQIQQIIDEGIEGIRNLSHDIIPVDIEADGADYAFHFLIRRTQRMYNIKCRLEADDGILNEISNRKIATHLYNIVQEAIKNAAVHGESNEIIVSIEKTADDFVVRIKDDGFGLPDSSEDEEGKEDNDGKGLRIMKHRMDLLGGTFNIEERDEGGMQVICTVPLEILSLGGVIWPFEG